MLDRLIVLFFRMTAIFLQWLPLSLAYKVGELIGLLAYLTNDRTRVAYVNLKAAFGNRYSAKQRRKIVRENFFHLAQNIVEVFRFPKIDKNFMEQYISFENIERFREAVEKKQGAIFLTPHFGNWEMTQIVSSLLGTPLHVLARRQNRDRLNDFLDEMRASHGGVTVHKGQGLRILYKILKDKGNVGTLGDLSGGKEGVIINFFGRKTTAPHGILQIAQRTNAVVLPCFDVRVKGFYHKLFFEEPFSMTSAKDEESDLRDSIQSYFHLLEKWIEKYPEQWFWIYKRWKYCYTKRILVLRDTRIGHANQAEAIREEFNRLKEQLGDAYDFEYQSVDVRFKSKWHQILFFVFSFLFLPFAQSRLYLLKWFFDKECAEKLESAHADFIISAGSSLIGLNLILKNENLGKSIVIMKPPFPYMTKLFDLLIVPLHDRLRKPACNTVRTFVAPNRVDEDFIYVAGRQLRQQLGNINSENTTVSVFIGGKSKAYDFDLHEFRRWLRLLKTLAEEYELNLLITTSRRTSKVQSDILKTEFGSHRLCKLLVIANESNIENVTYGILALSGCVIVTEDSVSMISEAVSAGRKVLVLKLGNGKLSKKHSRFHAVLESNHLIQIATVSEFSSKFIALEGMQVHSFREHESERIQEGLKSIL